MKEQEVLNTGCGSRESYSRSDNKRENENTVEEH